MAVVVYECDTCKREIEVLQVINGLEVMSHCIITSGCKGKLVQTAVKSSYVRGKLPDPDPTGLKDWLPRRVYFKQEQAVAIRQWKIEHNLGTNPSLQIHIHLADGSLIETSDYEFEYISPFEISVTFTEPRSGIAQCFARSSVDDEKREIILTQTSDEIEQLNITGNNILTLAVPPSISFDNIKIGFISSVTNNLVYFEPIEFTVPTSSLSPWWKQTAVGVDYSKVFFSGKTWNVITARLDDDINAEDSITDGSTFFFTNQKKFPIVSVNESTKTITVEGSLDVSLLPIPEMLISGSSANDDGGNPYTIVSTVINANGTTTIQLNRTITNVVPYGNILVDYPIDSPKMYILLSHEPYTFYDKNKEEVIDIKNLSFKNAAVTSQIRGILYVNEDQKRSVYPPIVS